MLCNKLHACWPTQTPLATMLFSFVACGLDLRHYTGLSPPVKYFTDRSKAVLLLWIFYVFVLSCVCYVLCASVYMCFVVTCWERADLLALVCGVFCEFVTFPLVSWVRCGTWLYRFLIFATLLFWLKNLSIDERVKAWSCVCHQAHHCLIVGFFFTLAYLCSFFYQSPLILTELFQHNLINVSYLTACYLYQVMMTLHFLNDVANDAESTQKRKITS